MFDRLRLLPTVMLCAGLLLGQKFVHLATGFDGVGTISPAHAASPEKGEKGGGETTSKAETEAAETAKAQAQLDAQTKALHDARVSPAEVSVLESLSARRDELDKRGKDIDLREQLLKAAEKRVEDRIGELKEIEEQIKRRIGENDQRNEERLAGVVKMYETMKPKDAARIFEQLDMGVLIDVARRMEPRKMSAVLAAMDPVTAQELTVELATGTKLPEALDGGKKAGDGGSRPAPQAVAPAAGQAPARQPG